MFQKTLQEFQKIEINVTNGKRGITKYNYALLEYFKYCFFHTVIKKVWKKENWELQVNSN